jgi:ubiquinone/menaquinone biosynthesis C-methylase UbiE
MNDKLSIEGIRDFWTQQAKEHGLAPAASWSDTTVMDMEIREIIRHLADGDRVLDVGCANGFSTVQFASQKRLHIRGLDYIPEMVAQARVRLTAMAEKLQGTAEFDTGDITSLKEPSNTYDKVVVIRVVINLHDWSHQLQGVRECIRVLKPGGLLLLSEATVQGWQALNKFRREWALADIPMPAFNQYLDEAQLVKEVSEQLELVELNNFSSTYYVGTRVLKPLFAQAAAGKVDPTKPDMEWNRWFGMLPAFGDYGTQKLFVFRKK